MADDNAARPAKGTILILEDEFPLRMLMRTVLQAEGYAIFDTDDGYEALERILQAPDVDLILVNLVMPIMTGVEFLKRLHELPANRRPPAVVVTGKVTSPEQDGYAGFDVAALLRKPYKQKDLVASVDAVLASVRGLGSEPSPNGADNSQAGSV